MIRDIMVHLDGSPKDEIRLEEAYGTLSAMAADSPLLMAH